jgi:hypothetical protein
MSFLNTLIGGFGTAVDTISTVAQTFVEKQRTNAKLNRLRAVMKSESELMNRAYIALGKGYYEQIKKGEKPDSEREAKLVELIDNCKARIAKARDCYRQIVEKQNEFLYTTVSGAPKKEEHFEKKAVVDITVACSNENEYNTSPFPPKEEAAAAEAAEETAAGVEEEAPVEELFES